MPHSNYQPERMGSAMVEPAGPVEAGSYQSFTVTYTAGFFGIDDTGSIKIVQRFASDMGRPQFDDPAAANYVSVEASNGAVLHAEYDMKRNIRPWDKTLYIKVVRGFLREGDRIVVRFGDPRGGCPGIRVQTFCEETFEFRVLVDAHRDLQLRGIAGPAGDRHQTRPAGAVEGDPADAAPPEASLPARHQGRG